MAKELTPEEQQAKAEKERLKSEKKQLQKEQKEQKKAAKKRAKEIAKQEEALAEDEDSNGFVTFLATLFIVALWLAVVCIVVKLDVGGFGSSVLTPILKDVPVVNKILPGNSFSETTDPESYGGYTSLRDAVDQLRLLELEIDRLQGELTNRNADVEALKAEVTRLQEFEAKQVEFQRIRAEFYEDVIYAEKGPGAEEYRKYYEEMDPTTAEFLYKQVVMQLEESREIQDYAATYSRMKPKDAAEIFEKTGDLNLVARILGVMNVDARALILQAMDKDMAAKLTKIMNPES